LSATHGLDYIVTAGDVMRPPVWVFRADSVDTAVDRMLANGLRRLVVVDGVMSVVGFIDEESIARAYVRHLATRRAGGSRRA
jgi:CBS domain-containing protein